MLTIEQRKVIDSLRDAGFLVVAFTPEEVGDIDIEYAEERIIEKSWDIIEQLKGDAA